MWGKRAYYRLSGQRSFGLGLLKPDRSSIEGMALSVLQRQYPADECRELCSTIRGCQLSQVLKEGIRSTTEGPGLGLSRKSDNGLTPYKKRDGNNQLQGVGLRLSG